MIHKRRLSWILIIFLISSLCLTSFSAVFAQDYADLYPIETLHAAGDYNSLEFPNDQQMWVNENGTIFLMWSEANYFKTEMSWSTNGGVNWTNYNPYIRTVGDTGAYVTMYYDESNGLVTRRIGQYYSLADYLDNGTIVFESGISGTGEYMIDYGGNAVVDSDGYAIFSFWGASGKDWVLSKNGNNDGTWADAAGYPMLDIYDEGEALLTQILIDDNDLCYVYYSNASNIWIQTLNGSTLSSQIAIADNIGSNGYFCAVMDDANTSHVVYLDDSNDFIYTSYNVVDGFTEPVTLGDGQSTSFPKLVFDPLTDDLYLIWFESAMYYQQYDSSAAAWLTEVQHTDTIASWISNERFTAYDRVVNHTIGVAVEHATLQLSFIGWDLDPDRAAEEAGGGAGPDIIWMWITDRMSLWFGLLGAACIIITPLLVAKAFKDGDFEGFAIAALVLGIVGFALVVGWLYA